MRLREKNLLVPGPEAGRYGMLESLRQYAEERLREQGELDAARASHLAWCLDRAGAAEPLLRGPHQMAAFRDLELDHDNFRAALAWALKDAVGPSGPDLHPTAALRLAAALAHFWFVRGYFTEGRRWLEAACAAGPADGKLAARLRVGLGTLIDAPGAAAACLEEGLALARASGDHRTACAALCSLGVSYRARNPERVQPILEEAVDLARALQDDWLIAEALTALGASQLVRASDRDALRDLNEALSFARATGDRIQIATALLNLGFISYSQGNAPEAERWLAESLPLLRETGARQPLGVVLHVLGVLALKRGDTAAAGERLRESLSVRRTLPYTGVAASLEGCAFLAAASDQPARAAQLFGAADRLRRDHALPMVPVWKPDYDAYLATARAGLPETAFEERWAEGQRMPVDAAIDIALAGHPAAG